MKKKRTGLIAAITAMGIICVVSVGVAIWAVMSMNRTEIPDYAPQQIDENAEKVSTGDSEKMDKQEGGGSVSLSYQDQVILSLSGKSAALYLLNPEKSRETIVACLMIDETVIAMSDALKPGYQLTVLQSVKTEGLSVGKYNGKLKLYYYDENSGEKASFSTDIPVVITVTD